MNILWLCNIPLPEISKKMDFPLSNRGGWLVGLANDLRNKEIFKLHICFPMTNIKDIVSEETNSISYYAFPQSQPDPTKYNSQIEEYLEEIIVKVNPDIIHIFGTEYPHTLAMVKVCQKLNIIDKVVINIQGLCSIIQHHYGNSLPRQLINSWTLRDIIRQDNIASQIKKFKKRGEFEVKALQQVKNVIGRTDWDRACTTQINSNVNYYFCNESLRDSFYQHKWSLESCNKYSLFVSQGGYPVKGLHVVLEALAIVKKKYPNVHLYIAGPNSISRNTLMNKLRMSSYSKYIGKLIKDNSLQDNITFTGDLSEKEMCQKYLKSHIFISGSSIENSPNSVGEAMLLGVPTISSDVGGVKNLLTHKKDGFIYQHDAPYMLAFYISEIFDNDELANSFSKNSILHAQKTHNREDNLKKLLDIYLSIQNGSRKI